VQKDQQKMMKKNFLLVAAGIAAVIAISTMLLVGKDVQDAKQNQYVEDNLLLKQKLAEHGISMSSPILIQKPEGIAKYCSFFTNDENQKAIEYCTPQN
jgi:hypothetical protein